MIIGRNIGAGVGGAFDYTIPGAPTGLGNPIIFAQMNANLSTQYIFSVSITVTGDNTFTYLKFLQTGSTTGGANAEVLIMLLIGYNIIHIGLIINQYK